jgi:TRAP-type mannitol/chloroaromatic compound transport system substrate-binding protein
VAKYYYYPGWHEPGPALEMLVNKSKFEALPDDLQQILRTACYSMNSWMTAEFDNKNGEYLTKLINEEQVDIRPFPAEVMDGLKKATDDALSDLTDSDPDSKRVYESFQTFKKRIARWSDISEKVFYETM